MNASCAAALARRFSVHHRRRFLVPDRQVAQVFAGDLRDTGSGVGPFEALAFTALDLDHPAVMDLDLDGSEADRADGDDQLAFDGFKLGQGHGTIRMKAFSFAEIRPREPESILNHIK